MTTPQRHRTMTKLAREIMTTRRAQLWTPNVSRRVLALLNERLRGLVSAGEIEPGWVAVIVNVKDGVDVQYTRPA